ncbi:MAG: hypothetical protein INF88_14640 [Roseomonas sp.]|nr:hypothetical protein [Roseomonas sp.]
MAEACTTRGVNMPACPMTRFAAGVAQADSAEVATRMRALLRGEETSPLALAWIGACALGASCFFIESGFPKRVDF